MDKGPRAGQLALTRSGQTEQPKDLKPDSQEKMRGNPRLKGWNFRHSRGCNEWINK